MPIKKPSIMLPKLNWAKVHFGYSADIILPLEEGIKIMEQLGLAESIDTSDYEHHKIVPFKEDITMSLINDKEYNNMKANVVLHKKDDE